MNTKRFSPLYVPLASLLILLLVNLWVPRISTASLERFQNPTPIFTADAAVQTGELSPNEAHLAQAVLQDTFSAQSPAFRLLYLGNSQSIIVTGATPADLNTPQWLQVLLARQSPGSAPPVEVRSAALPDLTMSEFLITLVAAEEAQPAPADVFIGAISLRRSTRDNAVLPSVLSENYTPDVQAEIETLLAERSDLSQAAAVLQALNGEKTAAPGVVTEAPMASPTIGTRIEAQVQDWLAARLPLFARRSELHNLLLVRLMYLRNRLFGVTAYTPRPFPETSYQANLELLELGLNYAQQRGLHVVLFLAPVRPLQPNPTTAEDIARFRRDIPDLCTQYDAICFDYVDLVPEGHWPVLAADDPNGFGGSPDFYHFDAAAHRLLAERLLADLQPQLSNWWLTEVARP